MWAGCEEAYAEVKWPVGADGPTAPRGSNVTPSCCSVGVQCTRDGGSGACVDGHDSRHERQGITGDDVSSACGFGESIDDEIMGLGLRPWRRSQGGRRSSSLLSMKKRPLQLAIKIFLLLDVYSGLHTPSYKYTPPAHVSPPARARTSTIVRIYAPVPAPETHNIIICRSSPYTFRYYGSHRICPPASTLALSAHRSRAASSTRPSPCSASPEYLSPCLSLYL